MASADGVRKPSRGVTTSGWDQHMLRLPYRISLDGKSFLQEEREWQTPSNPQILNAGGLTASRFIDNGNDPRERYLETDLRYYVLGIGLQPTNILARLGGRKMFDGWTEAGAVHLTQPGSACRGVFRAPTEAVHVYIPTGVLASFLDEVESVRTSGVPVLRHVNFEHDRVLEHLLHALSLGQNVAGRINDAYLESLCVGILAHLLRTYGDLPDTISAKADGLASWRLRRVIDYVAASLSSPISLTDLAEVAGLSRMHFAAQFRRSTGLRPHEYVQGRRIDHAQQLLASSDLSLIEIALSAGFANQAHFSRVFKRYAGTTPSAWRAQHGDRSGR
jgi:AraC family transcriptional regulator